MNNNVNNENQNVNLNPTNTDNTVVVGPTPTQSPESQNVNTLDNSNGAINSSPQSVEPVVIDNSAIEQSISETTTIPNQINTIDANTVVAPPVQENVTSQPSMTPPTYNLQPEGTVPQVMEPVQTVAEPLMSSTLNEQTILDPNNQMNNGVSAQPTVGMNSQNNNMDMTPQPPAGMSLPNINSDLMSGIPVPPPVPNGSEKNSKKKMNQTLLLVLIVVLVLLVGIGVYYVLFASKNKATGISINAVLTEVELGSVVPNEAVFFGTVTGMSINDCKVDSNIDPTKTGTYEYTLTCGNETTKNQVHVRDTVAPVALIKEVIVTPNSMIVPEDFIESVTEASAWTASFEEEPDTTDEGEFTPTIIVIDDYGNKNEYSVKLIVDEDAPMYYLGCQSLYTSEDFSQASVNVLYKYGINFDGNLYNTKKYIAYTFATEEEYQIALESVSDDTFDGFKGTIKRDDNNFVLTVIVDMTEDDLKDEFSLNPFPTTDLEIEAVHTKKNEVCEMLES